MTFRAVFISLFLLVGLCIALAFTDHWSGGMILPTGANHLPQVVVFILLIFTLAINPVLKLLNPKWVFRQSELIVIWCVVAAGATIPSFGLVHYMLPILAAPFYFVDRNPRWRTEVFDHIPARLVPSKNPESEIISMFFEGRGSRPFPWDAVWAWVTPFFYWSIVIFAFFILVFCVVAILRKQWVEYERLSFPLAQIPLEITRPPEHGKFVNAMFRSPQMWIGAALPIAFWTLSLLNYYNPSVPVIGDRNQSLFHVFASMFPGWSGWFGINFMALGVAFLLATDVSFSLWFFFIASQMQRALRVRAGYPLTHYDFEVRQQMGGFIAFAAIMLWTMRHHLRDVVRKAFTNAEDIDDSDNGLSYRAAVFGLILSSLVIVGWLYAVGCPPHISILLIMFAVLILIVISRFIAQCGLILVQTALVSGIPLSPLDMVQDFTGGAAIGPTGLTGATLYQAPMFGDPREVLMPTLLNNTKISERTAFTRKLFVLTIIAVLLAFPISYFFAVATNYQHGQITDGYAAWMYPEMAINRLATAIESPKPWLQFDNLGTASGFMHLLIGGGLFVVVFLLRSHLYWWFIHPVGILTAHTMPLERLASMFFVGWVCKSLAQKFAPGPAMYKIKLFFLGVIIGDVFIQMLRQIVIFVFPK